MTARLVRRELGGRPGRMALVGATVVVAVAFCVGAFGFSQHIVALIAPPATGPGLDLPQGSVVLTVDRSSITTATALDDALLARVRAVRGVAQANPNYDQPVAFVVRRGTQTERPPVLRGVVLATTSGGARWTLQSGRLPGGAREVAVDAGGAIVAGAGVGGFARLKFPIGTIRVHVVGVVAPAGSAPVDPPQPSETQVALASAHVLLDPDVAPILLDAQGRADRITVTPLPGVDPDVLASRLRDAVPSGIAVLAATSRAAETQQTIAAIDGDVRAATLGYAGLTMLVAILVIANSYSVLVAQRTRELGLLRLIGASRPQLMRTVLGESMVVGFAGAVIGGAVGVVLAYVASRIVRAAGVSVGLSLTWGMAVVAVAVGVSTSVVGASWPAWRAGRVAPIEALSDTSGGADRPSRGVVPAVMTLVGFAVATWAATRTGDLDAIRLAAIGAGVVAGLAGLALLSRWIVVPFSTAVSWPLRRVAGVTARLGVGNTTRQPSRTAGAASTLMVGLALVSIVGTFGASARQAIDARVGASGHADLYVQRTGVVRVSTSAVERTLGGVRRIGGDLVLVTAVDGVLEGRGGATTPVVAADPSAAARIVDLGVVAGDPAGRPHVGASVAPLPPAMVSTDTATALGVGIGDRVTLRSVSGGSRPLTVAATYTDTAIVGPAVVPLTTAREVSADDTFDVAALRLPPGVPSDRARAVVERTMRQFPRVAVDTPAGFAALSTSVLDTTLRIILVLLVGALGIGVLGLASTLALSTLERRRELVMLRAVGASRRQIRSLVWLEASMVGLIAAAVGIAIGTAVGRVAASLVSGTLGGSPVVPWASLALVGAVAVVVAWLVSIGVARRAAMVPPAEAGRM